jgi:PAS domain S-box-containing protein
MHVFMLSNTNIEYDNIKLFKSSVIAIQEVFMPPPFRVGLKIIALGPYWVEVREAIVRRAAELNLEFIPLITSLQRFDQYNDKEMTALVEDILAQDLAVVIGWDFPNVYAYRLLDAGVAIISHANELPIQHPLIVRRETLYSVAQILSKDFVARLGERGHVIVLGGMIQPDKRSGSGRDRIAGFRDYFDDYPQIRWRHIPASWLYDEAHTQFYEELQKIDEPVDAIIGLSDPIALAGRDVAKALGRLTDQMLIGGINGDALALTAIAEGSLTATVEASPTDLGYQMANLAYQAAQGHFSLPEQYNFSQIRLVTAANVSNVIIDKLNDMAHLPSHLVGMRRQEAQQQVKQLETSLKISQQIGLVLDRWHLSQEITQLICTTYGYDRAQIFLWLEDEQVLVLDQPEKDLVQPVRLTLDEAGVLGVAVQRNDVIFIPDVKRSSRFPSDPLRPNVTSRVISPIRRGTRLIGLLDMYSNSSIKPLRHELVGLESLAAQLGTALHNTELYTQVTERARDLQFSEARYRAIIEDQTDLVCRYLQGGILTFVNQTFCSYFNRRAEELLGMSRFGLLPDEERSKLEQHILSLNVENPVTTLEIREVLSDGEERWFHWSECMLFDDAGNFLEYQGVGRDITESKLAETQLQQMLEHAMNLNELKSRYLAMAAHDLRNPLSSIQSSIDIINRYADKLTEDRKQEKFDQITKAIKVMVNMLDGVLIIGQAEAGKLHFAPSSIDVTAFCTTMIQEAEEFTATPQRINFIQQQICGTAYLDTNLLRHILINLLSNALKYSPDDSIITFTLACQSDHVVIKVKDHGIGIPKAEQFRLFEAFHRASNAKNISGTGLGLAIVKQSVDLHGGTITFESQENVGTTFTVNLPQSPE